MRVRIGRSRKRNPLLHRELNQLVIWIKFIDRFPPAGGGKFNRQVACANKVESFAGDCLYLGVRPVTMDLNQIEMGEAINQPRRRDLANTTEVISIKPIDVASVELGCSLGDGVEHLIAA